jgi:hypothetical protein
VSATVVFQHQPGERGLVIREDGNAVLVGPNGERIVLDRYHVELAAIAHGCRLVETGRFVSQPEVPNPLCSRCEMVHAAGPCPIDNRAGWHHRRCVGCLASMGVLSLYAYTEAGGLCNECGVRQ